MNPTRHNYHNTSAKSITIIILIIFINEKERYRRLR